MKEQIEIRTRYVVETKCTNAEYNWYCIKKQIEIRIRYVIETKCTNAEYNWDWTQADDPFDTLEEAQRYVDGLNAFVKSNRDAEAIAIQPKVE